MLYVYLFFIFLIGAAIGSFLNVVSMRLPKDESIAFPPSHCDSCGRNLKWYDMFPVLSYIIYGGKCRYCKAKLSIQYPIVEALNGILYLLIFMKFGFSVDTILLCIMASVLLVIGIIDYMTQLIPDILVIITTVLGILFRFSAILFKNQTFLNILKDMGLGMLIGGGIFLLIYLLSRGGMGEGDVFLMASLGLILGFTNTLLLIFLSFVIGAVFSIFLLLFKIKSRKDAIPFGPFIVLSFYVVILLGDFILFKYFSLM